MQTKRSASQPRTVFSAVRRRSARMAVVATLCLGLAPFASPVRADTYKIDPDHTEVRFTWDHVGMSRQGGRFTDVEGTLEFDPVKPGSSSIQATIKVASISTGVEKLDEHLTRSGEFFDVHAHPNITFRSTNVAPTAGRTAHVTGNLSMNGVTKPVVMQVRWNFAGDHPLGGINPVYQEIYVVGFSATTRIRRSDWGLSRTVPFISDELRITIETELHRTQVTTPPLPSDESSQPGLSVPTPGASVAPPEQPGVAPLPPANGGPPHAAQPGEPPETAVEDLAPDTATGGSSPSYPGYGGSAGGTAAPGPGTTREPLEPLDGFSN